MLEGTLKEAVMKPLLFVVGLARTLAVIMVLMAVTSSQSMAERRNAVSDVPASPAIAGTHLPPIFKVLSKNAI